MEDIKIGGQAAASRTNKMVKKGVERMFRSLEEHAERFHGKRLGLLSRVLRFKVLVFGSVLAIGSLLTIIMSLD